MRITSGYFRTTDKIRLHYIAAGNGVPIIFVPGWTMPAEIWELQIAYLSRTFRVIAMDPRSQGKSAKVSEGLFPERRACDIKELIEHLQIAPVILVGWSLAVGEVLTYVEQFGTKTLHALVLVEGEFMETPNAEIVAERWKHLKRFLMHRKESTERFVRWLYKYPKSKRYLRTIIQACMSVPTDTAFTLLANVYLQRRDWRPLLRKIDCPLFYLAGASRKNQAAILVRELPCARVEIFESAGHALFVDEPDRFNKALADFVNEVSANPENAVQRLRR